MKVVWDEAKRLSNIKDHGLDFADALDFDWLAAMVLPSHTNRYRAVGFLGSTLMVALIFRPLGSEASRSSAYGPPAKTKESFMPKSKKHSDERGGPDDENPEWTKQDFANAKPFADVFPELAASIRRGRGPAKTPTKIPVSIRLSRDVVEHFKAKGPGWQTDIDDALRKIASRKR